MWFAARSKAVFVGLFGLLALAPGCATPQRAEPVRLADGQYVMGTVLELTLFALEAERGHAQLAMLFESARELDGLLSHYDPASEVSELGRRAGGAAMGVDPRVAEVLRLARQQSVLTGGAFDVTVGPLVRAWAGVAEADDPTQAFEIVAPARARVGFERLAIGDDDRVRLEREGMAIDLGGIGKGYALDRMAARLGADGGPALLNFGQSSVLAIGAPPGEPGWRLLVPSPDGGYPAEMRLRDLALSISSSFDDEMRGPAYGSLVDPRTGWPVTQGIQAAVVSPSAAEADALSTALLVLPPQEGIALVESLPDADARILDDRGRVATTTRWAERTAFRALRLDALDQK